MKNEKKPTGAQAFTVRFSANFTSDTFAAAPHTPRLTNGRTLATEVSYNYLTLDENQSAAIKNIYSSEGISEQIYDGSPDSQQQAHELLKANNLHKEALKSLGSRWAIKWSQERGKGKKACERVLYQCACGYDHQIAGSKTRHNPYDFTGCLAHVEVTASGQGLEKLIMRIRGVLQHNDKCLEALMVRRPEVALHPAVRNVALQQIRDGANSTDIQKKNRHLFSNRAYVEMPVNLHLSQYRWIILQSDNCALYRQHKRTIGINVKTPAHLNIDDWLNPTSPKYDPTLAKTIFYYKPRENNDSPSERLEICIAIEQMQEAAWKYAHRGQILLDGTFGLCDGRLLLFIIMGIDEERKGVPLAFLLFSAPGGNRQTSAGYNTGILTKLLMKWKDMLGRRGGEEFTPIVAITDTDLIERAALLLAWHKIWLLICKFHLRQSWRNHLNKSVTKSDSHQFIKDRLRHLQMALIETRSIMDAQALIEKERQVLAEMPEQEAAEGGLVHIAYLLDYWTTDSLWQSWSDFGRETAAKKLGRTFEFVIPTTNHLEAFNRVLKHKHLPGFKNGGRRVQVDMLIFILGREILPAIFQQREFEASERERITHLLSNYTGGLPLPETETASEMRSTRYCFLVADEVRNRKAKELLAGRQVGTPVFSENRRCLGLRMTCLSSLAVENDLEEEVTYQLWLGFDGRIYCNCRDFTTNGGACKHLRASLLRLHELRAASLQIPEIPVPTSEALARADNYTVESCRAVWAPSICLSSKIPSEPIDIAASAVEDMIDAEDLLSEDGDEVNERADSMGPEVDGGEVSGTTIGVDQVEVTEGKGEEGGNASRRGLDEQCVARLFTELNPRTINHLGDAIEGVLIPTKHLERARTLRDSLCFLSNQLTHQIDASTTTSINSIPPPRSLPSGSPLPTSSILGKRAHEIRAVSPDNRSNKRRPSYGIH